MLRIIDNVLGLLVLAVGKFFKNYRKSSELQRAEDLERKAANLNGNSR